MHNFMLFDGCKMVGLQGRPSSALIGQACSMLDNEQNLHMLLLKRQSFTSCSLATKTPLACGSGPSVLFHCVQCILTHALVMFRCIAIGTHVRCRQWTTASSHCPQKHPMGSMLEQISVAAMIKAQLPADLIVQVQMRSHLCPGYLYR